MRGESDHSAQEHHSHQSSPPDLLLSLMAMANLMRLSLLKPHTRSWMEPRPGNPGWEA
jgi:hypothetical protein